MAIQNLLKVAKKMRGRKNWNHKGTSCETESNQSRFESLQNAVEIMFVELSTPVKPNRQSKSSIGFTPVLYYHGNQSRAVTPFYARNSMSWTGEWNTVDSRVTVTHLPWSWLFLNGVIECVSVYLLHLTKSVTRASIIDWEWRKVNSMWITEWHQLILITVRQASASLTVEWVSEWVSEWH